MVSLVLMEIHLVSACLPIVRRDAGDHRLTESPTFAERVVTRVEDAVLAAHEPVVNVHQLFDGLNIQFNPLTLTRP